MDQDFLGAFTLVVPDLRPSRLSACKYVYGVNKLLLLLLVVVVVVGSPSGGCG